MIPVISPLSWVTDFTGKLSLSYHQSKHMARYVTGLITSRSKTIASMNSLFTDNLSSKSMNRFLTEYDWDSAKANEKRIQELQKHNETRWSKNGIAIFDDTLIHKTGKLIPHVYKFYDHSEKRFVNAQCIVTLHYADRKTNYPLDLRHYVRKGEPGFKTKIELAKVLSEESINNGMPASTFVFDSWYLCDDMVKFMESHGRFYIAACKSSLLVRWEGSRYIKLGEYVKKISNFKEFEVNGRKLLVFTKKVHFKSIGDTRLIISKRGKDIICLATNRKDHVRHIISDYMMRWKIEDFYKDAKQHLGLDKCQVRDMDAIKRHWHLVLLAHSILKLCVSESVFGRSVLHSSIGQKVKRSCLELLEKFAVRVLESKKSIEEVMCMLQERLIYRQS